MNQKKLKVLRRIAREETVGQPAISYNEWCSPSYGLNKDESGKVIGFIKTGYGVPLTLNEHCTRYVYKQLKKGSYEE